MKILSILRKYFFITMRIKKYQILSSCKRVSGKPKLYQPILLSGMGKIVFKDNVQIGVVNSQNFYTHYCYVEARNRDSTVIIGNNVSINNGFSAVALSEIVIEDNVLIGVNCSIVDSDGHFLQPDRRHEKHPPTFGVYIRENVFMGSNVTVMKGVEIGKNSVVGSGSVVTKNIPENVIVAGNPAKVLKQL